MTPLQLIIFYIFFLIIFALIAFPQIALRKHRKMIGEEIARLRPDLQAIKYQYNLGLVIGIPILILLIFVAGIRIEKPPFNTSLLFLTGLLLIGLFNGLFALITGVFPATTRWNWNHFIYDEQKKHRMLAQLQIGLSVLAALFGLAMFLFLPG